MSDWLFGSEEEVSPPRWGSLAERHRPRLFRDVVGHDQARVYLQEQARQRKGRSVLLHGPHGCGKTSLAEIYAAALFCHARSGEPCSEDRLCRDCRECQTRSHPNWRGTVRQDLTDAAAFLREVKADVKTEAWGGGWLVIAIDGADRLSEENFDALHDRLERTAPKVTYVLCAKTLENVPERTQSLFHCIPILAPGVAARCHLLERVCAKEGLVVEAGALDLLARSTRASLRWALCDLEAIASEGDVTLARVRSFYGLDGAHAIERYAAALIIEPSYHAQVAALDAWKASPRAKLAALEAYFADLFTTDILKLRSRQGASTLVDRLEERAVVTAGLIERAERLAMNPRVLFENVASFWAAPATVSDLWLLGRVSQFDELLNGPGGPSHIMSGDSKGGLLLPRRRRRLPARVSAPATATDATKAGSAGHQMVRGTERISLDQVRAIWDAGSFLVQKYGLFLNTRLTLRWNVLGVTDAGEVGRRLTKLLHEMRMVVDGAASQERSEPFHWIYVHETNLRGERLTHVAASLPLSARGVGRWLREDYLPHNLGRRCPPLGAILRRGPDVDPNDPNPDRQFARHLQLLRLLCRSLDPALPITVVEDGESIERMALIDRLGVRPALRQPIGPRFGAQRYGPSRLIAPKARHRAEDLKVLSAFDKGPWDALVTGWEWAEHAYRRRLTRQREEAEAMIDAEWPESEEPLGQSRREAEQKRFRDAWAGEEKTRDMKRPGFGIPLGTPDKGKGGREH